MGTSTVPPSRSRVTVSVADSAEGGSWGSPPTAARALVPPARPRAEAPTASLNSFLRRNLSMPFTSVPSRDRPRGLAACLTPRIGADGTPCTPRSGGFQIPPFG